jgi:hypothetical protein
MTVHRDKLLWIELTDAMISNFIGIATLHVSGSLTAYHQEFLAVHRHWYILCSLMTVCYLEQGGTLHPAPGIKRSSNCIKSTNADVRLRTPYDGQKGSPETCRFVIPIKLELSASVGFIHKEFDRNVCWTNETNKNNAVYTFFEINWVFKEHSYRFTLVNKKVYVTMVLK